MGGEQLQVNMVSTATLRSARDNPEAYRDLVVRVAGLYCLFRQPPLELQDGSHQPVGRVLVSFLQKVAYQAAARDRAALEGVPGELSGF